MFTQNYSFCKWDSHKKIRKFTNFFRFLCCSRTVQIYTLIFGSAANKIPFLFLFNTILTVIAVSLFIPEKYSCLLWFKVSTICFLLKFYRSYQFLLVSISYFLVCHVIYQCRIFCCMSANCVSNSIFFSSSVLTL